ncbi:MAG: trigger factor [Clostridiales bacterium]|nr:trigger factor [Clostridiales bacterium]
MKYTIKKLENKNIEIEMTLTNVEWEAEVEASYNKNKGKYPVEGFRKGKAPRKVIEKAYGFEVFYEDAIGEGFYKNYMTILTKEKDIEPVDAPTLSVKALDDKGIVIVAEIPVKPEVKIAKYTGLDIKVEAKKITAKEVNAEIDRVKEQQSRLVEKAEDATIESGDIANIDFEGSVDGKLFEGGTATGFDLTIGSHSFIDTFEDQLIGAKVGEERVVKVTFPAEYHAENLAGKPAEFKCKVNAIKTKEYPEINDEFASNVSEFETLADYKADIKAKLEKKAEADAKIEKENKIIDEIVKNMEVAIPECMIESELDEIIKDMSNQLMYQGIKMDDYLKYTNSSIEDIRKAQRGQAEKSVKVRLALQEIIKLEKLDVTKEDVDAKIKEMASKTGKTIKDMKASISDERISYIKNDILFNKLVNFLLEKNA